MEEIQQYASSCFPSYTPLDGLEGWPRMYAMLIIFSLKQFILSRIPRTQHSMYVLATGDRGISRVAVKPTASRLF
ncbi:hypothetical protein PISMIDRAFT_676999 [Pisolithus microcarpus 441]|uniref:Uncharacterized protein n=1 Tax=Pisolithus microcarpus 441 TaxID=765257 RepID=A0A0C9Z8Q3_9AGAM|nr:hypothetical protein PISMIDRAFT_676999 [Pisolithus microcarpus 441]